MKTISKTRSVGGSIMVTIPKDIIEGEMIEENELVEIEVKKVKKDYFGALKGMGKFTEKDRMEFRI